MKRREFVGAGLALAAAWPVTGWSVVLKNVGDLAAKSLDRADLTLPGSSVETFAASLRGDLLMPGSAEYDSRRRVWNATFDRKPALIACCTGASDVRRAVDFAREHRLLTAVRSGGHSLSGKSTCEGGLVIDLQSMQGVRVDPRARRAHLEAGSLLGQLDHECASFGLATTAGTVSHTGAAGLTLGGGFGRLGRRFGLACDNATSFDVVTADGHFIRASDDENMDLFWGLRGGGGNFGIVTAIEYRLHPMNPMILGGNLMWPLSQARDVMRFWRDIASTAPEVLNLEFGLLSLPDGPMVSVEACWSGDHAEGEAWLKSLRAFQKPVFDDIAPMLYVRLQSIYDEPLANGQYYYSKSGFLTGLDDAGIDVVINAFQRTPGLYSIFFPPCGGAYRRVAPDASAFPNRAAMYSMVLVAGWPNSEGIDAKITQIRTAWRDLEPLTRGFYTNEAGPDTTLAAYRENYGANFERLVALKAKYDPMNLFRLNANVPPKI
jgi:FAD/FMN-containing dehydrogenase